MSERSETESERDLDNIEVSLLMEMMMNIDGSLTNDSDGVRAVNGTSQIWQLLTGSLFNKDPESRFERVSYDCSRQGVIMGLFLAM